MFAIRLLSMEICRNQSVSFRRSIVLGIDWQICLMILTVINETIFKKITACNLRHWFCWFVKPKFVIQSSDDFISSVSRIKSRCFEFSTPCWPRRKLLVSLQKAAGIGLIASATSVYKPGNVQIFGGNPIFGWTLNLILSIQRPRDLMHKRCLAYPKRLTSDWLVLSNLQSYVSWQFLLVVFGNMTELPKFVSLLTLKENRTT